MNPRRLYRSRDRQLAGVAGGMAEYLDIDPTIMRILWIVVGIASGGLALIAYVLLALVIPNAPAVAGAPGGWAPPPAQGAWTSAPGGQPGWNQSTAWSAAPAPGEAATWAAPGGQAGWGAAPAAPRPATRGIGAAAIVGVVLIVVGGIALVDATLPGWSGAALLGPAVLLALGAALLAASIRRPADGGAAPVSAPAEASSATAGQDAASTPQATPWDGSDTESVALDRRPGEDAAGPGPAAV